MINLRQLLKEGGFAIGSWVNTLSPVTAELMSAASFDFLTVDAEHSVTSLGPSTKAVSSHLQSKTA